MHRINTQKTALAVALFLAVVHLAWALLVLFELAQPLIDFVLWAHMIDLQFLVNSFDARATASLIAVTFVFGYIFGYIFALLWNWLHKA